MDPRMPAAERDIARNRAYALWLFSVIVAVGLGCISNTYTIEYAEDGSGVIQFEGVQGTMGETDPKKVQEQLASDGWQAVTVQAGGEDRLKLTGEFPFKADAPPKPLKDMFKDLMVTVDSSDDGAKLYTWETSFDFNQTKSEWEKWEADFRENGYKTEGEVPLFGTVKAEAVTPEEAQRLLKNWPRLKMVVNVKLPGDEPVECTGPWENADAWMAGTDAAARFSWCIDGGSAISGKLVLKRRLRNGVEVLDANPKYNSFFDYTDIWANRDDPDAAKRTVETAAVCKARRKGAVADGASYLILRMRVPEAGSADFSIDGEEGVGGLYELGSDPFGQEGKRKLTVDAVATGPDKERTWYAFAFYAPPEALGPGRGARPVQVNFHFRPTDPAKEELKSGGSFNLIRPPVVLVHGTYDRPSDCWDTLSPHSSVTMKTRLQQEALRVFMVDWEQTNGKTDPSAFTDNAKTVWENSGGIKDALEALRKEGFAATQADLVCHSQGGVIARMYARGAASAPRPDDHIHFTNPRGCEHDGACYYHRKENFARGDIHRLITVSTTHMGSDNCTALTVYHELKEAGTEIGNFDQLSASLLCLGAGFQGNSKLGMAYELWARSGINLTGGTRDQTPGSRALKNVGRTLIPSHAIACTCEDEDMMEFGALYQGRYEMLWGYSTKSLLVTAWTKMGQPKDAEDIARRCDQEAEALKRVRDLADKMKYMEPAGAEWEAANQNLKWANDQLAAMRNSNGRRIRAALFGNCPNDATVREESSKGGLPDRYTTTVPRVLHGYAPTYSSIQERVVTLLLDEGSLFCKEGFPQAGGTQTNRDYAGPETPAVATDEEFVEVPSVAGVAAKEASADVKAVGLNVAFAASHRETPNAAAAGHVETESPPAGTKVKRGATVTLVVYGPYGGGDAEGVVVPSVVGLSARDAKAALVGAGFSIHFAAASGRAPTGKGETVERQSPAAGGRAPRGSAVTIFVHPK